MHSLSRYLAAGIPISLGTDTSPHDMIAEMRAAALLGKLTEGDARAATARQVFEAATLGGARALQRDDLGRLAPGAKADIVLVDLDRMHIGPVAAHDPLIALVYCAHGDDVDTVIVDGVARVRGGEVLGVDLEALWQGAERFNQRLNNSVQGAQHGLRPLHDVYAASFPEWEEQND
jgi:cytosine/adenosine deaminase-related metal-dependent hydrolase